MRRSDLQKVSLEKRAFCSLNVWRSIRGGHKAKGESALVNSSTGKQQHCLRFDVLSMRKM
jgi:hypothetical protein